MKQLFHEENLFRIKQDKELNKKLEITLTCIKAGIPLTTENIFHMLGMEGFGYSRLANLKYTVLTEK